MFNIYLTHEVVSESGGRAIYGRIQIEQHVETFITSLVCWAAADYQRQWQQACERLIAGERASALITSYVRPSMSEFLVWWPLYREGDIVHVRNELLVYAQTKVPFSIEDPWSSIRPRRLTTDEGHEISEWETSIQSIREFLD